MFHNLKCLIIWFIISVMLLYAVHITRYIRLTFAVSRFFVCLLQQNEAEKWKLVYFYRIRKVEQDRFFFLKRKVFFFSFCACAHC